jgi:tripartite-type tricarboxylate transporter receptor subunit TctC
MKRLAILAAAAFAIGAAAPESSAQSSYPTKTVKLIVPVTTGGPSDLVARILGDKLAAALGRPVIIENRPGASMVVGSNVVAKSEPDGYTLLQAAANMAINPILMSDLPYDTAKDFAPVSLTHLTPYVFVVSSQSPIQSLADLLKFARESPGKVTYGTTGPGSPQLLATMLLAQQAGLGQMTEIAYKGSSAAHPDLISDRVTFMIDPLAASAPHIKSGSLRALAVSTPQRNASFPNVPTAVEAGVPGYDFASWGGVFAPAGTPREIVLKINAETVKALNLAAVREHLASEGAEPIGGTPEEFAAHINAELARMGRVIRDGQIKMD